MDDPELKKTVEKIESTLTHMDRLTTGPWRLFRNGLIYGAGYAIGGIIILAIFGWILNVIGVIPAFSQKINAFQSALESAKQTVK